MTLRKIQQTARNLGLKNISRHRKESLIRAIQETEGNAPCFKGIDDCGEFSCLWREECQG
jgi:Rho termination factor, N-terminal domain